MANKKISEMTAAALSGTELLEVVQGVNNLKTTAGDIANLRSTRGKHLIPVHAGWMAPKQLTGCAPLAVFNGSSDQPDVPYLAFDASSVERAVFALALPKSWNKGTIAFQPRWMHPAAASYGVCWKLRAVAVSNDDTVVANYGTAQSSVDTGGTTSDQYLGPESAAITIAGAPAAMDLTFFEIYRDPLDAGDTLNVDAWLIGIDIFITTDADTDA